MIATDVLNRASKHTEGETISFAAASEWINEALETLGATSEVYNTVTVVASEKDTFYSFAGVGHNVIDVIEVKDSGKNNYFDFDVRESKIRFADKDTYSVTYRRMPAKITATGDTLEVHELYKHALGLFVASRYKSEDNEDNPDARRLMQEFWAEATKIASILRRQAKRMTRVKVWL